jgi:hypothetical protein
MVKNYMRRSSMRRRSCSSMRSSSILVFLTSAQ